MTQANKTLARNSSPFIFLVRHGEKLKKPGNPPLSKHGQKEATATASALFGKNIGLIIASPSLRSVQTAKIIGKQLKINISFDNRLAERIEYGFNGITNYEQYLYLCNKSTTDRNYVLPNGNTSVICGDRIKDVLEEYVVKTCKNLLIVGHGGSIADFLRNTFSDKVLNSANKYFARYKIIRSCSITQLIYHLYPHQTELVFLNKTDHLPVK